MKNSDLSPAERLKKARAHLRSALKLVSYSQAKMTLADVWITDICVIPEKNAKSR
jgi:hypothetical protein